MIGFSSGRGQRALDGVEAIHVQPVALPAAERKIAGIAGGSTAAGQKIRIERNHDIGGIELVIRMHRLSEDHLGRSTRRVRSRRIELMPLRRWKFLEHRLELRSQGGRNNRFGQNAEARALALLNRSDSLTPCVLKRIPILRQP